MMVKLGLAARSWYHGIGYATCLTFVLGRANTLVEV